MADSILDRLTRERDAARLSGFTDTPWSRIQARNATSQEDLLQARENKLNGLRELQRRREQGEKSFAAELGLHQSSTPYEAANAAAEVVSGASRTVGNLITAGLDAASMRTEYGIPQNVVDAYGREQAGTATPEDVAALNQQMDTLGGQTYRERLGQAQGLRDTANSVQETFDLSDSVDQRKRLDLSDDIAKGGKEGLEKLKTVTSTWETDRVAATTDALTSIADLIVSGGDALWENPRAGAGYIAEMIPDLVLGAASKSGLAVSSLGYGLENYRQGINKFQRENDGHLPDADTRRWMAMNAIGASLGDFLGDTALLRGIGKGVAEAAEETTSAVKRVASVPGSAVTEGVTEGAQAYAEGEARLEPATAEDIYENVVIGAGAGGGIRATVETPQILASAGGAATAGIRDRAEQENEQDALQKSAEETGDVSALTDPTKRRTYNPVKAAAAMVTRANNQELAGEEREAAKQSIAAILEATQEREQALSSAIEGATPEGIAAQEATIAEIKTELDATTDPEAKAQLQENLTLHEEVLADAREQSDPAINKALKKQLETAQEQVTQLQAIQETVIADTENTDSNVSALVERVAANEDTPERQEAATQLVHAMMDDTADVDLDSVQAVADSTENGLTDAQREFLSQAVTARKQVNALKDAGDVHRDVVFGGPGYKGLAQYRSEAHQALNEGDTAELQNVKQGLNTFLQHFQTKKNQMAQALAQSRETGKPVYMVRDPSQLAWNLTLTKPKGWQTDESQDQGWTIHKESTSLLNQVNTELKAIQNTVAEIQAAERATAEITPEPAVSEPAVEPAEQVAPEATEQQEEQTAPEPEESDLDRELRGALQERFAEPEPEVTEDVVATGESVAEVTSVDAPDAVTAKPQGEGKVSVLRQVTDRITGHLSTAEFKTRNLLANYFTQRSGKEGDTTVRPLVDVANFVSTITNQPSLLQDYFSGADSLNAKQAGLLNTFMDFAKTAMPRIEASLKDNVNPQFRYTNFIQYFRNDRDAEGNPIELAEGQSVLDENVKTAIAFSAFSYLLENAGTGQMNSDDYLRSLLGLEDHESISEKDRNDFSYAGTRMTDVANRMGQTAVQALGLKAVQNTPEGTAEQLTGALGATAVELLLNAGLAELHTSWDERLNPVNAQGQRTAQENPFIRLATNPETNPNFVAQDAKDTIEGWLEQARGTGGALNKLFNTEPGLIPPSLEPIEFDQELAKRTSQGVPSNLKEILKTVSQRKHFVREDMVKVLSSLNSATAMAIGGAPDPQKAYQTNRRMSEKAKYDAVKRSLTRASDFLAYLGSTPDGTKSPFYYMPTVWRQQRVGLTQNVMDPQGDKMHRHLVSMEGWERTIDPAKNGDDFRFFKLAVAQAMGIDTDKQTIETSLADLDALMASDKVTSAIAVLQEMSTLPEGEKLSPEQQQILTDAVKEGGEDFHSLDGLVHWAAYQAADGQPFTARIMYEVDGVTNGPALARILLGTADMDAAAQFGLYGENGPTGFADYKENRAGMDLYEKVSLAIDAAMPGVFKASPNKPLQQQAEAIYSFIGQFAREGQVTKAGRKRVKAAVTPLAFGASMSNSVDAMASAFIDTIYETIEAQYNSGDTAALGQSLRMVNTLLPQHLRVRLSGPDAAMEMTLSPQQEKVIRAAFKNTVGEATGVALDQVFGEFASRRGDINATANLSFELYNTAKEHLTDELIKLRIKQGRLPVDGKGNPLQGLNAVDRAYLDSKLKAVQPIAHTALSQQTGELGSGMLLSKLAQQRTNQPFYSQTVGFQSAIRRNGPATNPVTGKPLRKTTSQLHTRGNEVAEQAPGVAPMIMLVHAMDSAIAAMTYKDFEALHIHDAEGFALTDTVKGAQSLNKNTYEYLRDYSVAREVGNTYSRVMEGYRALVQDFPGLTGRIETAFENATTGEESPLAQWRDQFTSDDALTAVDKGMSQTVRQIDRDKAALLTNITRYDQYALDGGAYALSEEDKAVSGTPTPEPVAEAPVKDVTSPWGQLGKPNRVSTDSLASAFDQRPVMTAKQVGPLLKKAIDSNDYRTSPRIKAFQKKLLNRLVSLAPADLTLELVTPDTLADNPEIMDSVQKARGWYRRDTNTIQIKSADFVHSGLTPELLLHELVHAVTSSQLDKDAFRSEFRDLEQLRSAAEQYVNDNGITGFDNALQDVHELVAWGMTNERFQREVLSQITVESDVRGRAEQSGLRAFIKSLVDILFKGSDKRGKARYENGLAVLVQNAGLLFDAPTQEASTTVHTMTDPDPQTFTSEQVFAALAKEPDPAHRKHLKNVLSDVVEAAYGTFGQDKAPAERKAGLTPEDTFLNSLSSGEMPFTSKAISQFSLNEQEAFVLESAEVTLREAMNASATVRDELRRTFELAKRSLNASDFADPDLYERVFTREKNENGTSDYLSRFAALALVHKPLKDKLDTVQQPATQSLRGMSFSEAIKEIFDRAMAAIRRAMTGTSSEQSAGRKVQRLAERMAQVEAKRKAALLTRDAKVTSYVEDNTKYLTDAARNKLERLGRAKFFKNNRSGIVKAVGSVTSTIAGGRGDELFDNVLKVRDGLFKGRHDVITAILTEMRGRTESLAQLFGLLNVANKHEQDRQSVKEGVSQVVRDAFQTPLDNEDSRAITRSFIRTDISSLLPHFYLEEVEKFFHSPKELGAAIAGFERKLTGPAKRYYVRAAKDLGYHLATGKTRSEHLMLNAHNIAHLIGTGKEQTITAQEANQAWNTLEPLVTLYALKYLDGKFKSRAGNVLQQENRRTDGQNGVLTTLKFHQRSKDEAMVSLFDNNPVHVMKGYTRETFNHHVSLEVADEVQGRDLERAGYERETMVPRDSRDPNAPQKYIYVMKYGGKQPWLTGAISLSGKRGRGSALHGGVTSVMQDGMFYNNRAKTQEVAAATQKSIDRMFRESYSYDPRNTEGSNRLVPILNPKGQVVNYRYLMEDDTKDRLLDRDDRLETVMGSMAASIFDKTGSEPLNNRVIDALHLQYREGFKAAPATYIEFSPNSSDERIRETYKVLPEATKAYIRKTWGRNGMLIRKDILDLTFGYRKLSMADPIKRAQELDADVRTVGQQVMVNALEAVLGKQAWARIAQMEDVWQEVVKEVKDIWVVKNLTTLVGNVMSNTTLLLWMGVPVTSIVKSHAIALQGTLNYRRDRKELFRLQELVEAGVTTDPEVQQRIIELEDALARNPVKELMDAGLYQTIVEDIDNTEDQYSYKSRLSEAVGDKTQWMPESLKTAGKTLLMTHDTPLYQLLNQATGLSDFMARYTLHEHMTTRSRNPMNRVDSLNLAQDAFVNYDVPTHSWLQYGNDMGLIPFTKYYLRIQKVIMHMFKEHPARALGLGLIEAFFPGLDSVQDASFWHRLGNNPFTTGALKYPGALPELATVKGLMWPME